MSGYGVFPNLMFQPSGPETWNHMQMMNTLGKVTSNVVHNASSYLSGQRGQQIYQIANLGISQIAILKFNGKVDDWNLSIHWSPRNEPPMKSEPESV